jgi:DNA-binding HxlR family transcriptional regulator
MGNMKAPLPQCAAMVRVQNILSGKWKITILILWYIAEYEAQRFGELRRRLGDITQSTLTKQLRELEQDGFISRYIYQEAPPKVEYSLTGLGKSFIPILKDMKSWSDTHLM